MHPRPRHLSQYDQYRIRHQSPAAELQRKYNTGDYSTYFTKSKSVHTLKGLALPRACHFGEIALAGSRRLHSTLAAAPVLFAHAVVTEIKNK